MRQITLSAVGLGIALLVGCPGPGGPTVARTTGSTGTPATCLAPTTIKPRVSLAVTDLVILDQRFSLQQVLMEIIQTAGSSTTPDQLYQMLFDTNNSARRPTANQAGRLFVPSGPHCDDQVDGSGNATLNGFPLQCPRQEGGLADLSAHSPFCTGNGCDPYVPIALFNRLDLAPQDFSNCGQVHLLFGRKPQNPSPVDRTLLIFEAVQPNPAPATGAKGCVPVAKFWNDLNDVSDPQARAQMLQTFLFTGINGAQPALHFSHFAAQTGGIRTNQFKNSPGLGQNWQLREYKLSQSPSGLAVTQVTVKRNPFAALFDATNANPMARLFQDPNNPKSFIAQVQKLAQAQAVNDISIDIDDMFNGGQSTSQADSQNNDTDYASFFRPGQNPFRSAIQAKLSAIGSSLTPDDIVQRAQTQACGGCHQISPGQNLGGGLTWPNSLGFVQVSEQQPEPCQKETGTPMCWPISPAIETFLQARQADFQAFQQATACPVRDVGTIRVQSQPIMRHRTRSTH